MADLHDRWVAERHREYYYKLAKKEGYRSRASYKIMQIDDRFNVFHDGDSVVDLGACPGGWSQVARERVGDTGKVIGVDLRYIHPIDGVQFIIGDITDDNTMIKLLEMVGGKVDVVLSDMAPNIAGHYSMDHARSIELCRYAVDVCDRILKKGGCLVMKVFMGDMFYTLQTQLEKRFGKVIVHSPQASRPTSSEVYVISKGFLGTHNVRPKKLDKGDDGPKFVAKGGNF
ncbi:RlmE family RNA methyltransferase [Methanomethylophilus alvi]|uniref:RlmE family RNA methyltransferase n=1 Tax=Methanomethylophilus alvi TaxID=1291540 RepID=UPI0037DC37E3